MTEFLLPLVELGLGAVCVGFSFILLHNWVNKSHDSLRQSHKDHQAQLNAWQDDAREERRETLTVFEKGMERLADSIRETRP